MIKQGNERITITITPHEKAILKELLNLMHKKTYTSAIRQLIKEWEIKLNILSKKIIWDVVEIKKNDRKITKQRNIPTNQNRSN